MRKYFIFLLFVLLPGIAAGKTDWEAYIDSPSPEKADLVHEIDYSEGAIPENYGYWAPHLKILENQIISGDRQSLELALRLRKKSDGGLTEELAVIMGKTITHHPKIFLSVIGSNKIHLESLKSTVIMLGDEFADEIELQVLEFKRRQLALKTVSDEELSLIKEQCLSILEARIARLDKIIKKL